MASMSPSMASPNPAPEMGTGSTGSTPSDQQTREYSCGLCKKRKVRCDRLDPCSGCVQAGVQCTASTRAPYRRRKRLNRESENYQQSNSPGSQFHSSKIQSEATSPREHTQANMQQEAVGNTPTFGQDLWTGLNGEFQDPRTLNVTSHSTDEANQSVSTHSPLPDPTAFLFASSPQDFNLRDFQPSPVHAFILWQTFLQNINPLSRIIYAPQVQSELLEATKDFDSISKGSAALLFAIYAAAVTSMKDPDCENMFGVPKKALQARYMTATQQALTISGFLKSLQLSVLQAFVIYLLSARQLYDPQAFWLLTGMALRMGQRIKLSEERESGSLTTFEVQIRRRVWWQIIFIDGRSGQLCGIPGQSMGTHTFPLPANLNDADISPEMTEMPVVHKGPTEMIFCLVRYEFGKFLNANGRKLHSPSISIQEKDQLIEDFEDYLECSYLRYCDPAIPLHLLSVGRARSGVCKLKLMVHHPSQHQKSTASIPQAERDMLFSTSLKMVEYDVLGQSTKGLENFAWHLDVYFQIDAFVFMLIELCTQTTGEVSDKAWRVTSEVYEYRQELLDDSANDLYVAIGGLALRAWDARVREFASRHLEVPMSPYFIQRLLARKHGRMTVEQSLTSQSFGLQSTDAAQQPPNHEADLGFTNDYLAQVSPQTCLEYGEAASLYGLPVEGVDISWESMDWDYWNTLLGANGMQ